MSKASKTQSTPSIRLLASVQHGQTGTGRTVRSEPEYQSLPVPGVPKRQLPKTPIISDPNFASLEDRIMAMRVR